LRDLEISSVVSPVNRGSSRKYEGTVKQHENPTTRSLCLGNLPEELFEGFDLVEKQEGDETEPGAGAV